MKRILPLFFLLSLFFLSNCSNDTAAKKAEADAEKEALALDSISNELEKAKAEIDESVKQLEESLKAIEE